MKAAGCFKVFYGVESGSQRVLDEVCGKKITLAQVRQVSRWLDEVGIIKIRAILSASPEKPSKMPWPPWNSSRKSAGRPPSVCCGSTRNQIEQIAKERHFLPPDFRWSCKEDSKNLTFKAAHGNSPIFLDRMSWDDLAAFSMEWADGQNIPLWKRMPQASCEGFNPFRISGG